MARYSRVALYHKAQNAAHNQANKLKPTPFKKNTVEIPEAKQAMDPLEALEHEPAATAAPLAPAVKSGEVENKQAEKSGIGMSSKKMPKKVTAGSGMKKASADKKAAASNTKRPAAKAAGKKMTKKTAAPKKAAKSPAKKMASKAKPAKKMSAKKAMPKKMAPKKSTKKMIGGSKPKSAQRKTKK